MLTMTENTKKRLVAWLKDAHAMERGQETMLGTQAEHARSDPALHHRIMRHREETKHHATLIEAALERYGAGPSAMKDTAGKTEAVFTGWFTGAVSDTKVKDVLGGIAAEHFEIACYHSLEAAARQVGDDATVSMCNEILRDEEAMATFLEGQLPRVTQSELVQA